VLNFDGRELDLLAAKDAAMDLAAVAWAVWRDHAILRAPPGYRTLRRSEPPDFEPLTLEQEVDALAAGPPVRGACPTTARRAPGR
jgi:hypothetical protein